MNIGEKMKILIFFSSLLIILIGILYLYMGINLEKFMPAGISIEITSHAKYYFFLFSILLSVIAATINIFFLNSISLLRGYKQYIVYFCVLYLLFFSLFMLISSKLTLISIVWLISVTLLSYILITQLINGAIIMNEYNVYKHPVQGYEAIKVGFSWPALLFSWIWAFFKKLWIHGAVLIVATIVGSSLASATNEASRGASSGIMIILGLIGIACFLAPSIVAGIYGNKWRETSMAARGYKLLQTVEAGAPDGAIAIVSESNE